MKRFIPIVLISIIVFSSCDKLGFRKFNERKGAYEIPPRPPIPPQDFCYGLVQPNKGSVNMHLVVTGDSVAGSIENIDADKVKTTGKIIGIIFGKTLMISYKLNGQDSIEQQEWKWAEDSVYKVASKPVLSDSVQAMVIDSGNIVPELTLHKINCK